LHELRSRESVFESQARLQASLAWWFTAFVFAVTGVVLAVAAAAADSAGAAVAAASDFEQPTLSRPEINIANRIELD
jgi:lipopolysaccharide export LptBFGC system permease protein LptF